MHCADPAELFAAELVELRSGPDYTDPAHDLVWFRADALRSGLVRAASDLLHRTPGVPGARCGHRRTRGAVEPRDRGLWWFGPAPEIAWEPRFCVAANMATEWARCGEFGIGPFPLPWGELYTYPAPDCALVTL